MIVIGVGVYLASSRGGIDASGKPLGTDFISFWVASHVSLSGEPELAYNPMAHEAAEAALFPGASPGYTAFFYPPTFLLVCLPLALLPYAPALAVWLSGSFLILFQGLRRVLPQRWALLPLLSFPGILINLGHGQNGFITAACMVWSMVLLPDRPYLAGISLGFLVIKPHLLLAAPVVFIAARQWAVTAGIATSGLVLCGLSWLVFGVNSWYAFLNGSRLARATLEQGFIEHWKFQSVFSAVRLFHGNVTLAYILQAASALTVCLIVVRANRHGANVHGVGAMLPAATLLCTPFLFDYDLVCLAPALAWIMAEAQGSGWRPWEKAVLLAAFLLPLTARFAAMEFHLPLAPIVIFAVLLVAARRATTQGLA